MNIAIPTVFTDGPTQTIYAAEVNANFDEITNKFNTYAVQTDVAKTITVQHEFSAGILARASSGGLFIADNTASAAINAVFVGKRGGATKWYLAHDASDQFAVLNAAGDTANITVTNVGDLTVRGDVNGSGALRAGSAALIYWQSRSIINSPSDGVVTLTNQAQTAFTRLQFGGTASSFPSLKRSTVDLHVKLADDSAYTNLDALAYKASGTQVVSARKTGWAVATGTATRTTFATASVTLPQLAERVKALIDDLHGTAGHGLIGT